MEYAHNNHATSFAIIATENLELIFCKNFFIIKEEKINLSKPDIFIVY